VDNLYKGIYEGFYEENYKRECAHTRAHGRMGTHASASARTETKSMPAGEWRPQKCPPWRGEVTALRAPPWACFAALKNAQGAFLNRDEWKGRIRTKKRRTAPLKKGYALASLTQNRLNRIWGACRVKSKTDMPVYTLK